MAQTQYSKEKVNISLDERLLKKIDKIKKYPRWRGNRNAVIEWAVEEL